MKQKKYTQLILTLLFLNIFVNVSFSQVSDGYKTPFLGHWVNVNYDREDTVLYLPYNSEQVQKMKPEFKQAGITLKEQDLCYLHFWQWCGNDTGNDYRESTWILVNKGSGLVFGIHYPNEGFRYFKVVEYNKNKLVMLPVP